MSPNRSRFRLSLRGIEHNDDHHLWNNHGTWWCHFTLHCPTGMKQRVRRSLRTSDLSKARLRRDALLTRLQQLASSTLERRGA